MKEIFLPIFMAGGIVGMLIIGIAMTHFGPNSRAKVDTLKTECELNIPRNQICVMQFIPEKK